MWGGNVALMRQTLRRSNCMSGLRAPQSTHWRKLVGLLLVCRVRDIPGVKLWKFVCVCWYMYWYSWVANWFSDFGLVLWSFIFAGFVLMVWFAKLIFVLPAFYSDVILVLEMPFLLSGEWLYMKAVDMCPLCQLIILSLCTEKDAAISFCFVSLFFSNLLHGVCRGVCVQCCTSSAFVQSASLFCSHSSY